MLLPHLTFFTSLALLPASFAAVNKNPDGSCSLVNNLLQVGTFQLTSDCADDQYCSPATNKCTPKGCRKDEFPLGYAAGASLPKKCGSGSFCPDEGDDCQPQVPVLNPCQLNRDGKSPFIICWALLSDLQMNASRRPMHQSCGILLVIGTAMAPSA